MSHEHNEDETEGRQCSGHFIGAFEPENYKPCRKASVVVFVVEAQATIDGMRVTAEAPVGSCEEHEAQRRAVCESLIRDNHARSFREMSARAFHQQRGEDS